MILSETLDRERLAASTRRIFPTQRGADRTAGRRPADRSGRQRPPKFVSDDLDEDEFFDDEEDEDEGLDGLDEFVAPFEEEEDEGEFGEDFGFGEEDEP